MPNWMSGRMRIRGSTENLLNFFRNGINMYGMDDKFESVLKPREGWYSEKRIGDYIECNGSNGAYVEGTKRAFLEDFSADIYLVDDSQCVEVDVYQAWSFDSEDWRGISEKYKIDIWLRGEEPDNAFSQTIKIVGGEIKIDRCEDLDDWED